jgi:hypothetical protein
VKPGKFSEGAGIDHVSILRMIEASTAGASLHCRGLEVRANNGQSASEGRRTCMH